MASARRIVWLHDPAGLDTPVRALQDALHAAGHFVVAAVVPEVRRSRQTRWTPAPSGLPATPISPPHREQDARLDDAERSRMLGLRLLQHGNPDGAHRLARLAAASPISETLRRGLRALKPDLLVVSSWPRATSPSVEWMRTARAIGCPVACVVTDVSADAWPWCEPALVIVPAASVAVVRALGYEGVIHGEDALDPDATVQRLLVLAAEPAAAVEPRVSTAPWRRLVGLSWRHRGMPWWARPVPLAVDAAVGAALLVSVVLTTTSMVAGMAWQWPGRTGGRLSRTGASMRRNSRRASTSLARAIRTVFLVAEKTGQQARKRARRMWRDVRHEGPRRLGRLLKQTRKSATALLRRGVRAIRGRRGAGRPPHN